MQMICDECSCEIEAYEDENEVLAWRHINTKNEQCLGRLIADQQYIANVWSALTNREREVLSLLHAGMNLMDVAIDLGITESRVCQIRNKFANKLAEYGIEVVRGIKKPIRSQ
jgi:DNA-directed RNA polymerase specialized sigma subunit